MAAASASLSAAALAAAPSPRAPGRGRPAAVRAVRSLAGSLPGAGSLRAAGAPARRFDGGVGPLRAPGSRGGAPSTRCNNAASEIFKIAGIMNVLVLIGVAVGFVLLRLEAWVEEGEAE